MDGPRQRDLKDFGEWVHEKLFFWITPCDFHVCHGGDFSWTVCPRRSDIWAPNWSSEFQPPF